MDTNVLYGDIYDPLNEFQPLLKKHQENVENYFNNLVKKSNIDVEKNKATVKKINKSKQETTKMENKLKGLSFWKIFMIICIVLFSLFFIGYIIALFWPINIYDQYDALIFHIENKIVKALVIILSMSLLFIILFSTLLGKIIIPKIKNMTVLKNKEEEKLNNFLLEANDQMKPLNALFKHGTRETLFNQSIPLIKLDRYFDKQKLSRLENDFDLNEYNNDEQSFYYVKSGEIKGNPFVIAGDVTHTMGTKIYYGHLTISWSETYSDSQGHIHTRTRTETLTASLKKPYPYYNKCNYLILGSEVEPKLSFSRSPIYAHKKTDKELEKYIKSKTKELTKKADKNIGNNNFTLLGNSDFDVIWNAFNRNDEKGFRMLFTPLAQKSLTRLLKDKTIGYGDDFKFGKSGKINLIIPEHLMDLNLELDEEEDYTSYDFGEIQRNFLISNLKYFKHIYFTFAPLLSIPIYQQTPTHEYIYRDKQEGKLDSYEYENILNNLGSFFKPLESVTENIIKTKFIQSKDQYTDLVEVNSWGYKAEKRTDYVTVRGGDGNYHDVPIVWYEYIVVDKNSTVEITALDHYRENEEWKNEYSSIFPGFELNEDSKKIINDSYLQSKSAIVKIL